MTRSDAAAIAAAAAAAQQVAAETGVGLGPAEVLHAGANVVVRLSPEPVVARVAHWTRLSRPAAADSLGREVALATWLAERGAAVVPPAALLPAGPHRSADGHVMTFWTAAAGPAPAPDPAAAGAALAGLHTTLAGYTGDLPDGPLQVVADSLAGVEAGARAGLLDAAEARELAGGAVLADAVPSSGQALHGDAHPGNQVATAAGEVLWVDFDDAFRGPPEWDLMVLAGTAGDEAAVRAGYTGVTGVEPAPELVAACRRLREWQAVCWVLLGAVHHPDRVEMARDLLTRWLAPGVEHVFD